MNILCTVEYSTGQKSVLAVLFALKSTHQTIMHVILEVFWALLAVLLNLTQSATENQEVMQL